MNFLSPSSIALAAALTVPPLVALYFLKLRREPKLVPSTLLWKRTVEDLRVNAPFQRLRSNLLLLLQLMVLVLGAFALGQPMLRAVETHRDTIILLVDQSASMAVVEADGRTRLEQAKEQAKRTIDNMAEGARAMIIAYSDRAAVVSSFDRDRDALKRRIEEIEQTQSSTQLAEALTLAEAYAQNIIIGSEEAGRDIAPESAAAPADLFLFTDGRIADADKTNLQNFDLDRVTVHRIGARGDNVGITAMQARRHYERPEILDVTVTVQNFGDEPITLDATLFVDEQPRDVKTITLAAGRSWEGPEGPESGPSGSAPGGRGSHAEGRGSALASPASIRGVSFDPIEFSGSGIVEVGLKAEDALSADNRAWAIVAQPKRIRALLVTKGNMFLEGVLGAQPIEVTKMTPALYEAAEERIIADGERSAFDVVMFDRHSTSRLPIGNYMFWGSAPVIEGVEDVGLVNNEIIFNWNDTHPLLRHVDVENITVFAWRRLKLPVEASVLIEGSSSPVMAYVPRGPSQFLISAFSLIVEDDVGVERVNTTWSATADFVMFMQNAVQFLGANLAMRGQQGVAPGEPVSLPVPRQVEAVDVLRPDGQRDRVVVGSHQSIHYTSTQRVGLYRLEPPLYEQDAFAVNLMDPVEGMVYPADAVLLGMEQIEAQAGNVEVNQPAWHYFLLALQVFLLLEWVVYNKRVFV
jgi:hypothetical protein